MDSCTCLGLVVILGTLLPTATFGADAIAECCSVLQAMEAHSNPDGRMQVLPHAEVFSLDMQQHCVPVSQIKAALHELGLGWSRLLCCIMFAQCLDSGRLLGFPWLPRFSRKVPANKGHNHMRLSTFVATCLRMRSDRDYWSNLGFRRMTKRLVHFFCQQAEIGMEKSALDTCPDPTVGNKYHPFMLSSRRRGNKALRLNVVQRFLGKGAGYISLKDEKTLYSLGVVSEQSTLANRTASEYVARLLIKSEEHVQKSMEKQHFQTLNFCFDAASFAGEQAETGTLHVGLS